MSGIFQTYIKKGIFLNIYKYHKASETEDLINVDILIKDIYFYVYQLNPNSKLKEFGPFYLINSHYIDFYAKKSNICNIKIETEHDKLAPFIGGWRIVRLEILTKYYENESKDRKEMEDFIKLMYNTFTLDFYTKSKYIEIIPSEIIDSYWK